MAVPTVVIVGIFAFLGLLTVLWILMPIAVFKIREDQKETTQAIASIEADVSRIADQITRMAEIQEKEHKLKMIAAKATQARKAAVDNSQS